MDMLSVRFESHRVREKYLVGLVVVLGVVLKHLRLLLVVEGADELLDADASICCPPLLTFGPPATCQCLAPALNSHMCLHLLCQLDVEFACTEESQLRMI